MGEIQMKSNGLFCTFLVFGVLFGIAEQTSSFVILSAVTSRVPSSSGNSSLSVTSSYSGYLFSNGPQFHRPYGSSSSLYFYQAIQVTVYVSGIYTFTSSSSMDTYGCLYDTTFHPSSPYTNLLYYDDDSGTSRQFLMNCYLQSGYTYILVVTTSFTYTSGSYTALVTGPGTAYMTSYTPSDSVIHIAAIVGITIGCLAFCIFLIVTIIACRRRQQTFVRQTIVPAQYNANSQNVYYPGIHGNAGQGYPPSYDTFSPYRKV